MRCELKREMQENATEEQNTEGVRWSRSPGAGVERREEQSVRKGKEQEPLGRVLWFHRPERRTGTVAAIGGVGQRQNVNRKRVPFTKSQKKAPRPGLGEFP